MTDDASRDAYYAYGVDLIRTAGLLLRTTPSVVYRASILFQRFEASVDTNFRARYISAADMPAFRQALEKRLARLQRLALQSAASPHGSPHMTESTRDYNSNDNDADAFASVPSGAEYLIPSHAQQEMRTGLVPLVDLRAPLDYCLHHLIDQEDIIYLCAACLLIATKMEDPAVRVRAIVNTCMRLSERRAGVVVNELQKPPPARYEDFKACVVDAEEVVLHQLGFQTFVESPYKYVLLYLNILVEPAEAAGNDSSAGAAAVTSAAASLPSRAPSARSPSSVALTQWAVRVVQLVNDLPRCRQLLGVASDVLALYAIQQTCPADLRLPSDWTNVFGVPAQVLADVSNVYAAYLRDGLGSCRATTALSEIRAKQTVAPYRTVAESVEYETTLKGLMNLYQVGVSSTTQLSHDTSPAPPQQAAYDGSSLHFTAHATPSFASQTASIEELRELIGASTVPPSQTSTGRRDRSEMQGNGQPNKRSRGELHPGSMQ